MNTLTMAFGSIIFGTIAAVASVPADISTSDALFRSGLYMTIALLLPIALQARTDLNSLLRVENVLMLGITYWLLLDLLQSAYPFSNVNPEHVQTAFAATGAFALAIWAGASGRTWALPRAVVSTAVRPLGPGKLHAAVLIAFILGMANFVVTSGFNPMVMIAGLGTDRWGAPWARGDLGDANALLDHTQYFGYLLPSLCVMLMMRVGFLNWRTLTSILASAIMVVFLSQAGGRRIIGVVIGAAIFTWILSQRRLRPTVIVGVGVASLVLLLFMQEMLRYRNVGFGAWWNGERPEFSDTNLHVDDNFLRLSQLIRFYPESEKYALYRPLYHALSLPVPRVLWPGKPTGPGFDLPGLLGRSGVSFSSSILGELYVSLGLWAVVAGGLLLGKIAGMWNKILLLPHGAGRAVMYSLGVMALFTGLRSMQALVQMSYIVLAWIAVAKILSKSGRFKRTNIYSQHLVPALRQMDAPE